MFSKNFELKKFLQSIYPNRKINRSLKYAVVKVVVIVVVIVIVVIVIVILISKVVVIVVVIVIIIVRKSISNNSNNDGNSNSNSNINSNSNSNRNSNILSPPGGGVHFMKKPKVALNGSPQMLIYCLCMFKYLYMCCTGYYAYFYHIKLMG